MLTDLISSWFQKVWFPRSKPIKRPIRKQNSPASFRLKLEALEDRLVPASTVYGGLEFLTTGTFTTTNQVLTTSSPVQVGVNPAQGSTFTPLLQLDNGVRFTASRPHHLYHDRHCQRHRWWPDVATSR